MSDDLILLGVFGAPHGVKGEVRLKSYTADPSAIARYGPLRTKDGRRFEIASVRPQNDILIARVRGVADRLAAEALVNLKLYAARDALGAAEEDEFFHADLLGLEALTIEGISCGRVSGLFDFGAGELLEITPAEGRSFFVPFTRAAVPVVDIKAGRVVIDPPAETADEAQDDNGQAEA